MNVIVDRVRRRFPMSHVKIRWKPSADSLSATVRVDYPSYSIEGKISVADMKKLIDFGERTNTKVWTGEDDFAQMVDFIQDVKYGEPKDTDDETMKWLSKKLSKKS